ncbi:NTPase [Staphylococcus aureus]|nr:NTPase [Staphylococcus aureus]
MPKADDDTSSYSTSEKNGITLMLLIGKFLEKFGSRRDFKRLYLLMRVGLLVLQDKVKKLVSV